MVMKKGFGPPPSGCELKLNDCVNAGIGPSCCTDTTETSGCNDEKKRCEDQVKRQCEEALEDCIKNCQENIVKAYERMVKAEKEREAAERRERAEAQAKCEAEIKQGANYDTYMNAYRVTSIFLGEQVDSCAAGVNHNANARRRRIATGGDPPFLKWDAFPNNQPTSVIDNRDNYTPVRIIPYVDYPAPRPGPTPSDYAEVPYLEKQFGPNVCGAYKAGHAKAQWEWEQAGNGKCKTNTPDNKRDPNCPCDECRIKEVNAKLAQCWSACYAVAANGACRKAHCSCASFKCPGPDVKYYGAGSGSLARKPGGDSSPDDRDRSDNDRVTNNTFNNTLSAYGTPLELIYTRAFLPGNLLWLGNVTEEREFVTVSDYDDNLQQYIAQRRLRINNFIDMFLGLCAGEVDAISRVWLNGQLIYDKTVGGQLSFSGQERLSLTLYTGSESQKVQKQQAQREGFGRVPAYRGLAGMRVVDINLSNFDAFPAFKVEVIKHLDTSALSDETTIANCTDIIKIDYDARRVFILTNTGGVRVFDYDTLAEINTDLDTITDAIEVTALPAVIANDTGDFVLYDTTFGDERARLTSPITIGETFLYRHVDENNYGTDMLLTASTTGQIYFHRIDDVQATITFFNGWSGVLAGLPQALTHTTYKRPEGASTLKHVYTSTFALRATTTDIAIREFVNHATQSTATVVKQAASPGGPVQYVSYLLEDIFDAFSDGVVELAIGTERDDGGLILFLSFDTGTQFKIVRWHPYDGIMWDTAVTALPTDLHVRASANRYIYFIDSDGAVQQLDVETGVLTERDVGTIATQAGAQFFDSETGNITYWTGTSLAQVFADRVASSPDSVASMILDLGARVGLTPAQFNVSGVADVTFVGFRSGPLLTARPIIEQFMEAFGLTVYEDDKIIFLKKAVSAEVTVDQSDLHDPFGYEDIFDAYDTQTSTVTYYSDELDGEENTQRFSLPDDVNQGKTAIDRQFTLLANDDFMRSLAELLVFTYQEKDAEATISLPWKYLTLTPTDMTLITQLFRTNELEIGADLSLQIKLSLDGASKYANFIEITGTSGFGGIQAPVEIGEMPGPIAFSHRAIGPNEKFSADTLYGATNVTGEYDDSEDVSVTLEAEPKLVAAPGAAVISTTLPVSWGYLVTPPSVPTNYFTTQVNDSLSIKFVENSGLLQQIYDMEELPLDLLYSSYTLNTLVVGHEIIQFRDYVIDSVDPTLVTFNCLLRARWSTDAYLTHTAGELCYIVDYDNMGIQRRDLDEKTLPIKTLVTRGRQQRHYDVVAPAHLFAPMSAVAITRWDRTPSAGAESVFFPANPHVFIQADLRFGNCRDLNKVMQEETFLQNDYQMYLLRDYYNEATFYAELDDFEAGDFSYIMALIEPTIVDMSAPVFDTAIEQSYYGILWTPDLQDVPGWEAATEPLTAVVVSNNLSVEEFTLEENKFSSTNINPDIFTLSWATWTPGDYLKRRWRGTL